MPLPFLIGGASVLGLGLVALAIGSDDDNSSSSSSNEDYERSRAAEEREKRQREENMKALDNAFAEHLEVEGNKLVDTLEKFSLVNTSYINDINIKNSRDLNLNPDKKSISILDRSIFQRQKDYNNFNSNITIFREIYNINIKVDKFVNITRDSIDVLSNQVNEIDKIIKKLKV